MLKPPAEAPTTAERGSDLPARDPPRRSRPDNCQEKRNLLRRVAPVPGLVVSRAVKLNRGSSSRTGARATGGRYAPQKRTAAEARGLPSCWSERRTRALVRLSARRSRARSETVPMQGGGSQGRSPPSKGVTSAEAWSGRAEGGLAVPAAVSGAHAPAAWESKYGSKGTYKWLTAKAVAPSQRSEDSQRQRVLRATAAA